MSFRSAPGRWRSPGPTPSLLSSVVVLVALVFCWPADAAGHPGPTGDPWTLNGVVVASDTGLPLPGVTVAVEGGGGATVTDRRGAFRLRGSDPGRHAARFSRIGFADRTVEIEVGAGATVEIEVALEPRTLVLDPLSVLLERTRMTGDPVRSPGIPGSAFHLGREELEARKVAFDNVHDVLRQVPGVHVQDEEGYGLRPHIGLRGAGGERSSNVTLMEDGVLIAPAPYSAPAAYYFPTMGRMEGLEVRKGASQIRHGPRTLGGAVNLLTSSIPERRAWHAEVAGGGDAMLRTRVRAGDASDHVGWVLEGYQLRTDGFKELQGGGDTGFRTRDLLAKLRLNTNRDARRYQELELKLGVQDHTSDETYLGLTEADFRATPDLRYAASRLDVMDADHRQLQARYFLRPTETTDVVVTAYRNAFARNWYKLQSVDGTSIADVLAAPADHGAALAVLRGGDSDDDALVLRANNREYLSQGVQATLGFRVGERVVHELELGVRYHVDEEDRLQWEDGYRMLDGSLVRTSEGAPGSQANRLSEARAWAFHLQDLIQAGRWSFVPGVRWERIAFDRTDWSGGDPLREGPAEPRTNSVSVIIPGIGATYAWSPWTHLFAGVHRGFGPPGPGADDEARAEESMNWESGVRVRRAGVGLDLTAFLSRYDNILGRATLAGGESGTGELFNGGEVRVRGLEASVDADLDRYLDFPVRMPVRMGYTLSRGRFLTSFESEYGPWGEVRAGDRVPHLATHQVSGSVGLEEEPWALRLDWTGSGRVRTVAGRGPIPPGTGTDRFLVLSLSGELAVADGTRVYAALQNLTDERYLSSRRPAGARPGLPRTFFVGVAITR
jgi:Fe(3+) dicitrate transport protein